MAENSGFSHAKQALTRFPPNVEQISIERAVARDVACGAAE